MEAEVNFCTLATDNFSFMFSYSGRNLAKRAAQRSSLPEDFAGDFHSLCAHFNLLQNLLASSSQCAFVFSIFLTRYVR